MILSQLHRVSFRYKGVSRLSCRVEIEATLGEDTQRWGALEEPPYVLAVSRCSPCCNGIVMGITPDGEKKGTVFFEESHAHNLLATRHVFAVAFCFMLSDNLAQLEARKRFYLATFTKSAPSVGTG